MSRAHRTARGTINAAQIGLVKLAVKQLGIDDATYREMLRSVAGVSSAKDLDTEGLDKVMDHLKARGFVKTKTPAKFIKFIEYKEKWRKLGSRPGMATPGQLAAIEVAWNASSSFWNRDGQGDRDRALRGFLQAKFKVDDLRFLSDAQASKVIYAITAIRGRKA